MGKEIQIPLAETGATLYAIVRNTVGDAANVVGEAFVEYATASLGSFDIPLTEEGTASRYYAADFPTWITKGRYYVTIYKQAGAAPAEGDTLLGHGIIDWTGTAVLSPADTIWDVLSSALTTPGSIGELLVSKLAILTSSTSLVYTDLAHTGGRVQIWKGETRTEALGNAFRVAVSGADSDWTDLSVKMILTRLPGVDDGGDTDAEVIIEGTIVNPGEASQYALIEMGVGDTGNLALSDTTSETEATTVVYSFAYRYTVIVHNADGSVCATVAEGRLAVLDRSSTVGVCLVAE